MRSRNMQKVSIRSLRRQTKIGIMTLYSAVQPRLIPVMRKSSRPELMRNS